MFGLEVRDGGLEDFEEVLGSASFLILLNRGLSLFSLLRTLELEQEGIGDDDVSFFFFAGLSCDSFFPCSDELCSFFFDCLAPFLLDSLLAEASESLRSFCCLKHKQNIFISV